MKNALSVSLIVVGIAAFGAGSTEATVEAPDGVSAAVLSCNESIPLYVKAIANAPNDAALHNRLGVCYQKTGETKRARKEYERATKLDKKFAVAWNNLGTVYHAAGKHSKAMGLYRKAIELKPDFVAAYANLGSAALGKGEMQAGVDAYREALRLDPQALSGRSPGVAVAGVPEATQLYFFAKAYAAEGRVEESLQFLTRARAAGFSDMDRVRTDSDFASVVKDARFSSLGR